jgi:alpha-beta hydrolase superfamily lysophospholipase
MATVGGCYQVSGRMVVLRTLSMELGQCAEFRWGYRMSSDNNYSALDGPEILQFVFYPRQDHTPAPSNATDHFVLVDDGAAISCRFYVCAQDAPSILYFHGNGEVVSDYDYIAPVYNRLGVNLFVADYRGYGSSSGTPTFSALLKDAHIVFRSFNEILREGQHTSAVFVMGRSLGSIPGIELALHYGGQMEGLIIESGIGSMSTLMAHMGLSGEALGLPTGFPNVTKIRSIKLPTLILHGEYDSLIPATEAYALYENSASQDRRLVIIPNAEHNDIMMVGGDKYFGEIRSFVSA